MDNQNTEKAEANRIAICNYKFEAWNGKKVILKLERKNAPLIGSSECDIRQDKTGYNRQTLLRYFKKQNKTRKNLNDYSLYFTEVEVHFVGLTPVKWK